MMAARVKAHANDRGRPPERVAALRLISPGKGRRSLDLDGGAGALEGLGGLLGGLLVDLLQDRLRGGVHEVLGLLQTQGGQLARDLDDLYLLLAGAGEDDVELVLLLDGLDRGTRARGARDG